MSVKEGSYKPYSEVVISSIIYGSIGVFLNKVQDMSIESILFSISFFVINPKTYSSEILLKCTYSLSNKP